MHARSGCVRRYDAVPPPLRERSDGGQQRADEHHHFRNAQGLRPAVDPRDAATMSQLSLRFLHPTGRATLREFRSGSMAARDR